MKTFQHNCKQTERSATIGIQRALRASLHLNSRRRPTVRRCTLNFATVIVALLCLGFASQNAVAQTPFSGTSWDDFSGGAKAVCDDADIDNDDDGLIEICTLDDLNSVRHVPDGSGLKTTDGATKIDTGCKTGGCNGYELVRDLDFQLDTSYRDTANKAQWETTRTGGWTPIESFSGTFDGNGHTISNLRIDRRRNDTGLFGTVSRSGKINGIGLLNVIVHGVSRTGGLAGTSTGPITNSYSTGLVEGDSSVGGLVGRTETNAEIVSNSYSMARVKGDGSIGGLVGNIATGPSKVTNSYCTGTVLGNSIIGGLAGAASGDLTKSYSIGQVDGNSNVGGILGSNSRAVLMDNYWDTETSGQLNGIGTVFRGSGEGVTSKTSAQLRAPTAPGQTTGDIYYNWSTDDWDFGTSDEYPAVKVNGGGCRSLSDTNSQTLICGALLSGQRTSEQVYTIGETATVSLDANKISGLSGDSLTYLWQQLSGPTIDSTASSTRTLRITVANNLAFQTLVFSLKVNGQRFAVPSIRILGDAETTGTVVIDSRNAPDRLTANIDDVSDANGLVEEQTSYQWFRQVVGGSTFEMAPGATSRSFTYTLPANNLGRAAGTQYRVAVTFVDVIGSATTLTSAGYEIQNKAPVIAAIASFSTTEGLSVIIDATDKVSDPNNDTLSYAWHTLAGDKSPSLLAAQITTKAVLTFTVPTNWVVGVEAKHTTVTLQLTVSDATTQTATSLAVVIAKTSNGSLTEAAAPSRDGKTVTAPTLDLASDPDSSATAFGSILSYQWQSCPESASDNCVANSSNWTSLNAPDTDTYTVSDSVMDGDRLRVIITYRDGQGYTNTVTSDAHIYEGTMRIRLKVFLEGALQ